MAMPPPDSASPPDQAPPEGAPQEGPPSDDQVEDPKQLLMDVNSGLAKIASLVSKAGAPPDVVKDLEQCVQLYRSAVGKLLGVGGSSPADQGMGSPEAGGNPNAQPMP